MDRTEKVILVVEDDPDDEALILRALRVVRNNIVVVRDGVEALDHLFGTGPHAGRDVDVLPQVMVLDLKLPKVDGLEVLRRVRADPRTQFLPVVVLTSSSQEQDMVDSYKLGANSYVQKPVEFGAFSEAVRQLGLYWMLINHSL